MTETSTQPVASTTPPAAAAPRQRRWPVAPWLTAVLVAVGLVAGLLGGALLRPLFDRHGGPGYSDEQATDAKNTICAAYSKVHQAVVLNTGRSIGEDAPSIFAVAANARMALFDGGEYLLAKLNDEPATPADLTAAVRSLAEAYQELAIGYLAEVAESESQAGLAAVDQASEKVFQMCQ